MPASQTPSDPEDNLALERSADFKSEFFDGEIFAPTAANESHNLIVTNAIRELSFQFKKFLCKTYTNNLQVQVDRSGLCSGPDVVVVCGKAQFDDAQLDTLLNPTLIVEVLSDSTQAHDRGRKFEQYRKLESLAEYVLTAQNRPHIDAHRRRVKPGMVAGGMRRSGRGVALAIQRPHAGAGGDLRPGGMADHLKRPTFERVPVCYHGALAPDTPAPVLSERSDPP
ncbi:MAG: Uma2 family endonuclease [Candidatus Competibacteraceae bacterium]|nr:Uma2 family endonuclease [Candidatus Competibacteraceae bacterium]MBK9950999.1 Uma2 family endonuclease [Candidatus Competibacteraceae bacterium]